jgi:pSer/pThr/pTyr-binding forkhead associated (FHA) protein
LFQEVGFMGLQLRIRHSLGARMIEVDERGPDRPVLIGRDPSCDIQVPSGAVAPTHAMLYAQDGQWVVADAAGGSGTFINGHPIDAPAYVSFGDTVSLGSGTSAPRIEIDPMGTARRAASARASALAATRPSAPSDENWTQPQVGPPAAEHAGWVPPTAPVQEADAVMDDVEEPGDEQWGLETQPTAATSAWPDAESPAPRRYRRRPRKPQSNLMAVGVGLAVGIAVVGAILIYTLSQKNDPPPHLQPAPTPAKGDDGVSSPRKSRPKSNIFDGPAPSRQGQATPPEPGVQAGEASAPKMRAPRLAATAPDAPLDPRKQTQEWKNVESARDGNDPAKAIWAANDYMTLHPGEFTSELKGYIDEALDDLWWKRLKDLCDERDRISAEIARIRGDIAAESPGSDFIKTLETKKNSLEFQKNAIIELLTQDMGYTAKETPNPLDQTQIDRLSRQRDKIKFDAWSRSVLGSIKKTRDVPWVRAH